MYDVQFKIYDFIFQIFKYIKASVNKKSSQNDHDDDEDDDENSDQPRRSRAHIDDILKVYEIGSQDVSVFNFENQPKIATITRVLYKKC